ncbi:hypothetical protein ACFFX0_24030 [Citricoccus parietis]|uniref:Uncharacterized protein n=1 Tax=Citricoccus parietis TaxID=592307 RepID=A0ABV5G584_9MICC
MVQLPQLIADYCQLARALTVSLALELMRALESLRLVRLIVGVITGGRQVATARRTVLGKVSPEVRGVVPVENGVVPAGIHRV